MHKVSEHCVGRRVLGVFASRFRLGAAVACSAGDGQRMTGCIQLSFSQETHLLEIRNARGSLAGCNLRKAPYFCGPKQHKSARVRQGCGLIGNIFRNCYNIQYYWCSSAIGVIECSYSGTAVEDKRVVYKRTHGNLCHPWTTATNFCKLYCKQ